MFRNTNSRRHSSTTNSASTSSTSSNEPVFKLLHRLGGVYRDPSRISRDANSLLSSSTGQFLRPSISPLVEDDGTSSSTILLKGTISMVYRGVPYNIPIDLYLPPAYPARAPVIFVRPIESMMIKEGHKHVAADGRVYMPYLHSWRPHSHTLVQGCEEMSRIFGIEPPCFAKPPGYTNPTPPPPPVPQHQYQQQQQQQQPTPPSYEDVNRLSQLEKEAAEANAAAEVARRADADERASSLARTQLIKKYQASLLSYEESSTREIEGALGDQIMLDKSMLYVAGIEGDPRSGQLEYLNVKRRELEEEHGKMDDMISEMTSFLSSAREEESKSENIKPVDELAVPMDICSAQLLALSAENAAITDALFFLDKGLAKGRIGLDVHLKAVRKLANRQFLVRFHLLKVGQVKAYSCNRR